MERVFIVDGINVTVRFPDPKPRGNNEDGDSSPEGYEPYTAYYQRHADANIRCMVKCRYCTHRIKPTTVYRCEFLPRKTLNSSEWKFCDHFVLKKQVEMKIRKEYKEIKRLPYDGGWLDKQMVRV